MLPESRSQRNCCSLRNRIENTKLYQSLGSPVHPPKGYLRSPRSYECRFQQQRLRPRFFTATAEHPCSTATGRWGADMRECAGAPSRAFGAAGFGGLGGACGLGSRRCGTSFSPSNARVSGCGHAQLAARYPNWRRARRTNTDARPLSGAVPVSNAKSRIHARSSALRGAPGASRGIRDGGCIC